MSDSVAPRRRRAPLTPPPPHAYMALAAELEVLIRGGHFSAGDRLPSERQLADRFRISRPTVRAALGQLEARGLVVTRSGSGTFIATETSSPNPAERSGDEKPAEVLGARLVLEVALVRLAARHAAGDQPGLEDIRLDVEALESVARPEDVPIALDVRFHQSVARLTGNSYLVQLLEPVWETMTDPAFTATLQDRWSREATIRTAAEHRAIYEALRVGDGELAAFAMERHLRSLAAALLDDSAFDGPPPRFYA